MTIMWVIISRAGKSTSAPMLSSKDKWREQDREAVREQR